MDYNSFVPRPLNTRPSTLTLYFNTLSHLCCDTQYIMYMSVCPLSYTQFPVAHSIYCCVSLLCVGAGKFFVFKNE